MGILPLAVLLAAVTAPVAAATPSVAERMDAVHREMVTHFSRIVELSGDAVTIETRIEQDIPSIDQALKPKVFTQDEFDQYASELATLDGSLIDQLSTGKFHAIAGVRGADEIFIRSPYDHSLQPAA